MNERKKQRKGKNKSAEHSSGLLQLANIYQVEKSPKQLFYRFG